MAITKNRFFTLSKARSEPKRAHPMAAFHGASWCPARLCASPDRRAEIILFVMAITS
jgi:hypothetical protein